MRRPRTLAVGRSRPAVAREEEVADARCPAARIRLGGGRAEGAGEEGLQGLSTSLAWAPPRDSAGVASGPVEASGERGNWVFKHLKF